MTDMVNHPPHYKQYSFEVIELTERLPFCAGNAVKYILRAPFKGTLGQDIEKAIWYLDRAIKSPTCKEVSEQMMNEVFHLLNMLVRDNMNLHARSAVLNIVSSGRHPERLGLAKNELLIWKEELRREARELDILQGLGDI